MQRKQPNLSVASLMALMQPTNRLLPRVYRLDAQGRPARAVRKCALPGCLVEHELGVSGSHHRQGIRYGRSGRARAGSLEFQRFA